MVQKPRGCSAFVKTAQVTEPENLMNHDTEQLDVQSEAFSDFKLIEMLKKIQFLDVMAIVND